MFRIIIQFDILINGQMYGYNVFDRIIDASFKKGESDLIDIERLREYFKDDCVFITEHAAERFRQRGIKIKDIQNALMNGEIIEQYPDDYPFPSCLILGIESNGNPLHICMSDEGETSRIITAYYPDLNKWSSDFRTRREDEK